MRRRLPPLVAGAVLSAALAIVSLTTLSGSPRVNAAGASPWRWLQTSTATPAAPVDQAQASVTTAGPGDTASPDPADDLTTATVDLHAGYIMDPYLLPVVGKTEKRASELVKECNGFVGAQPSVTVNWFGKTDQLSVFTYSDGDAVLAIRLPDGSFICNDDAGARTVDPLLTVKNPAPGVYKIHVGAAKQGEPALGFLAITQAPLDSAKLAALDLTSLLRRRERPREQALPQLDPRTLLADREAIFGSTDLAAGFKPVQHFAAGGGDIPAIRLENQELACAGYITAVPSYSFTWTGSPRAARVFFEGLNDSALVVVTPNQEVICGMNASPTNLNPVVDIASLAAGKYRVYVAAMEPNAVVGGKLTLTGDLKATPAVLQPAGQ